MVYISTFSHNITFEGIEITKLKNTTIHNAGLDLALLGTAWYVSYLFLVRHDQVKKRLM